MVALSLLAGGATAYLAGAVLPGGVRVVHPQGFGCRTAPVRVSPSDLAPAAGGPLALPDGSPVYRLWAAGPVAFEVGTDGHRTVWAGRGESSEVSGASGRRPASWEMVGSGGPVAWLFGPLPTGATTVRATTDDGRVFTACAVHMPSPIGTWFAMPVPSPAESFGIADAPGLHLPDPAAALDTVVPGVAYRLVAALSAHGRVVAWPG